MFGTSLKSNNFKIWIKQSVKLLIMRELESDFCLSVITSNAQLIDFFTRCYNPNFREKMSYPNCEKSNLNLNFQKTVEHVKIFWGMFRCWEDKRNFLAMECLALNDLVKKWCEMLTSQYSTSRADRSIKELRIIGWDLQVWYNNDIVRTTFCCSAVMFQFSVLYFYFIFPLSCRKLWECANQRKIQDKQVYKKKS